MIEKYWHSVTLREDLCTGCTVCMQNCPTQAIRVINGKAQIISEKCIDCGKCIKVCPFNAKTAITDDIKILKKYKYTVALPSISFYSQFSQKYSKEQLHQSIKTLGFDAVYNISNFAEVISVHLADLANDPSVTKPIISTYCPAITRLIQIRNPELIGNIAKLESPMEVAARNIRHDILKEMDLKNEEIGIFLLAQCPAKITSIKSPIGIVKSSLDGAFSIKDIFPTLLKQLISFDKSEFRDDGYKCYGELWGRIGGQSEITQIKKSIKVDGIYEVSKILDMLELGKLSNIDFLEAYSCNGGCVGGPLNVENPFIARYRIENRSKECQPIDQAYIRSNFSYDNLCWDLEIKPLKTLELDTSITVALEKMERINEIIKKLPGIDCGACGSPSCNALAEDIVQNRAVITDCIFVRLKGEEYED